MAIEHKEKDVRKYKSEFNIVSPIMIDDRAVVARTYEVQSHPETFFISREGKIIGRTIGAKDWTSKPMRNFILYILGEKK